MKFSLHLSNVALALITSALLGVLLLTDIGLRLSSGPPAVAPAVSSEKVVTRELTLTDSQGRVRIRMSVDDSDAPSLQMYGQDGGKRALLRLNQNDAPSLRLYDANGLVRSVTGFTLNDMQPVFAQFDDNGVGHAINSSPYFSTHPFAQIYDEDRMGQNAAPRADPFASLSGGSDTLNLTGDDSSDDN